MEPRLIILGGLPGSGKTTISHALARELGALVLRVDTIEHVLKESWPTGSDMGPTGYIVAFRLAAENLKLGRLVVADTVNPIEVTRTAWRNVAQEADVPFLEVEILCTNKAEHKLRVESRSSDIVGFQLPTWQEVEERTYEPWESATLRIDTAVIALQEAVQAIASSL